MWKLLLVLLLLLSGCGKTERPPPPTIATVSFTGSMKPTLQGGETLTIDTKRPIESVKEQEMVVVWFSANKMWVVHRVIAIRDVGGKIGLVTKGDANMDRDWTITTKEDFGGVVILVTKPR